MQEARSYVGAPNTYTESSGEEHKEKRHFCHQAKNWELKPNDNRENIACSTNASYHIVGVKKGNLGIAKKGKTPNNVTGPHVHPKGG